MIPKQVEKGSIHNNNLKNNNIIISSADESADDSLKDDKNEECVDRQKDDYNSSPSSETAGIARGAAKSILSGTKRGVRFVGKKPMLRKTPTFPRSLRARQVSRISDRLSTGIDVVSTATEEDISDDNVSKKRSSKSQLTGNIQRFFSFAGGFIKNSVLGIALFETYEGLIRAFDDQKNQENSSSASAIKNRVLNNDAFSRADVSHHFVAGAFAGLAFSSVSFTFNTAFSLFWKRSLLLPRSSEFITNSLNSSFSNATLFGTYEGSKRIFLNFLHNDNSNSEENSKSNETEMAEMNYQKTHTNIQLSHIFAVTSAGIFAGMSQNIVSHYMEAISAKLNDQSNTASLTKTNNIGKKGNNWLQQISIPQRPNLRTIFASVPGTAIGFVAFEYSKELFQSNTFAKNE